MSIEVHNIGRLRVSVETTFGTEVDFSGADSSSILSVPAIEGSVAFTLDQAVIDPNVLVVFKGQKHESELGLRSATLSFSVPAMSPGATTVAAAHTRNALGYLLKYAWGGENLGEGFDITASTTGGVTVTGNSETDREIYGGSAVGVSVSSLLEWRPVSASNGNDATFKFVTTGAASTSADGQGCSTYYPTEDPSSSLQFAVYGVESDDRWLLLGGQLESMSLDMAPGGIPQFNFSFKFANWLHGSASSTLASTYEVTNAFTGAIAAPSFTNANYVVNNGGWLYWSLNGTTTYSATQHATSTFPVPCTSESVSIGYGFLPAPSPSGTQTIARWVRSRTKPAMSGEFSVPYEDVQWFVDKTTKLNRGLFRVIGGTAGSTMIIDAPTVQVTNVQRVDDNGLAYQKISWEARHDAVSTLGNGDAALARAPFRIHFG